MVIKRDARLEDFFAEFADARSRVGSRFKRIPLLDGVWVSVFKDMEVEVWLVGEDFWTEMASVNLRINNFTEGFLDMNC